MEAVSTYDRAMIAKNGRHAKTNQLYLVEDLDGSPFKVGPGTEGQRSSVHVRGLVIEGWIEVAKRASDETAYTRVKVSDLREEFLTKFARLVRLKGGLAPWDSHGAPAVQRPRAGPAGEKAAAAAAAAVPSGAAASDRLEDGTNKGGDSDGSFWPTEEESDVSGREGRKRKRGSADGQWKRRSSRGRRRGASVEAPLETEPRGTRLGAEHPHASQLRPAAAHGSQVAIEKTQGPASGPVNHPSHPLPALNDVASSAGGLADRDDGRDGAGGGAAAAAAAAAAEAPAPSKMLNPACSDDQGSKHRRDWPSESYQHTPIQSKPPQTPLQPPPAKIRHLGALEASLEPAAALGSQAHPIGPRNSSGLTGQFMPAGVDVPAAAPPPPFVLPDGADADHSAALDFLQTLSAFLSQHGQEDVRLRLLRARQQLRRGLKGDPALPDWNHCNSSIRYLVEEVNWTIEEGRDMGSSTAELAAQVAEALSEGMEAWRVGR